MSNHVAFKTLFGDYFVVSGKIRNFAIRVIREEIVMIISKQIK